MPNLSFNEFILCETYALTRRVLKGFMTFKDLHYTLHSYHNSYHKLTLGDVIDQTKNIEKPMLSPILLLLE